jgi:hypothetical protein
VFSNIINLCPVYNPTEQTMNFSQSVIDAFATLTPDLAGIYTAAHALPLSDWRVKQQAMVTGSGALAIAVPGVHLLGMAADVAFLMNRMAVCCYGIGAIAAHAKGLGQILEPEDFAIILARWSGDENLSDSAITLIHADLVAELGSHAATQTLARGVGLRAGILVGKKITSKAGAKIGAKFAGKMGSKALAGFIPVLGAAAGGGINLWFITSIANEAQRWFELKTSFYSVADTVTSTPPLPPMQE